jgi:hypothetical protein
MLNTLAGIIASSGGAAAVSGSYESIATVTASGGESSLSFTSIPSTYQHLQIRGIARTSTNNYYTAFFMQFNSDTASNYNWHYVAGYNSITEAYGQSDNKMQLVGASGNPSTSNGFGATVIDILDYANTSKYKTTRGLTGYDNNASAQGYVELASGLWRSTSAVSSILLKPNVTFAAGTTFALYGIKG